MFISHLLQHLDLVRAHAHDLPEYLVVRHHAEPEVEQQHCPDGHNDRHTDLATLSDVSCYIMGTWGLYRGGDVHAGGQVHRHHQHSEHLQRDPESDGEKLEDNERHHHPFLV